MNCRVILVRHLDTTWSELGVLQGTRDPPLSATGVRSLPALALLLGRICTGVPLMLSSDLRRAVHTARPVADRLGWHPVELSPALREVSFGIWEGRCETDLQNEPELRMAWSRLDPLLIWPGAAESLAVRAVAAAEYLMNKVRAGGHHEIVAVSHGLVIQAILAHWVLGDLNHARAFELAAGSVSVVGIDRSSGECKLTAVGVTPSLVDMEVNP